MAPDLTVQLIDGGIPGWITQLIAVALGGLITLGSTFAAEHHREEVASKKLALAIAAEVEATIRMANFRGLLPLLEAARDRAAAGTINATYFEMGDDYLPVSRSAMTNVGALPGMAPHLLAEMLTLVRSLKIDLDDIARPNSLFHATDPADQAERYAQMVVILGHALATATQLVAEIGKHHRLPKERPWDRVPSESTSNT